MDTATGLKKIKLLQETLAKQTQAIEQRKKQLRLLTQVHQQLQSRAKQTAAQFAFQSQFVELAKDQLKSFQQQLNIKMDEKLRLQDQLNELFMKNEEAHNSVQQFLTELKRQTDEYNEKFDSIFQVLNAYNESKQHYFLHNQETLETSWRLSQGRILIEVEW